MMSGRSSRRDTTITGNPPGWSRDLGGQTNAAIQGRWEVGDATLLTTFVVLVAVLIVFAVMFWPW